METQTSRFKCKECSFHFFLSFVRGPKEHEVVKNNLIKEFICLLSSAAPLELRHPNFRFPALDALPAPDVLEEAVALGEAVEGVVALTHGADEAAEGVDVVVAGDGAAVLVDLGDGNLDGAVVLGLDDAVGGAALAGDVTEDLRSAFHCISASRFLQSHWRF